MDIEDPTLVAVREAIVSAFVEVDNARGEPASREQIDMAHIAACAALESIGGDPGAVEQVAARVRDAGVELRNPAVYAHYYFLVDGREQQVCLPVGLGLAPALVALSSALGVPVTEESLLNIHPSGRIVVSSPGSGVGA